MTPHAPLFPNPFVLSLSKDAPQGGWTCLGWSRAAAAQFLGRY